MRSQRGEPEGTEPLADTQDPARSIRTRCLMEVHVSAPVWLAKTHPEVPSRPS